VPFRGHEVETGCRNCSAASKSAALVSERWLTYYTFIHAENALFFVSNCFVLSRCAARAFQVHAAVLLHYPLHFTQDTGRSNLMQQRQLGPFSVSAIGLGCMSLSHAYGTPPPPEQSERLLLAALDAGVTLLDTAALYGFGANEELVGRVLGPHRQRFTLASKGGMAGVRADDGVMRRVIDGRPEAIRRNCEDSLRRLGTDVIDLYYLHRWDKQVPIEDSVGAMSELVRVGKARALGLSEVSALTLRRAHAVHPIAALQTEYSLWTRNPEIAVLEACRDIGAAFVAFSPLGRGFLSGAVREGAALMAGDIRKTMPRFTGEHLPANLKLLDAYNTLAHEAGCTPSQLALAWLLHRAPHIVPIPGTTQVDHLQDDLGATEVRLSADLMQRLDALINQQTVSGHRYAAQASSEIDTEDFG
jgi:aryl-alcohol dehydrogenase-like predicted oxidoreductase